MVILERSSIMAASLQEVFEYCTSRHGFLDQFPFPVRWISGPERWHMGDTLEFKYRFMGIWLLHKARIVEFERNRRFVDDMVEGPYRRFTHAHLFRETSEGTEVVDRIEFCGGLGIWVDRTVGLRALSLTFTKRHASIKTALEART